MTLSMYNTLTLVVQTGFPPPAPVENGTVWAQVGLTPFSVLFTAQTAFASSRTKEKGNTPLPVRFYTKYNKK